MLVEKAGPRAPLVDKLSSSYSLIDQYELNVR